MKEWTIDDFLKECEELCWNEYTYDYTNMPEGICNGHYVAPYEKCGIALSLTAVYALWLSIQKNTRMEIWST